MHELFKGLAVGIFQKKVYFVENVRRNMDANPKSKRARGRRLSKYELERMVEEAVVDAYGESEQVTGLYTMLEDNLALPFDTVVLGLKVTVEKLDLTDDDQIVVVCRRGSERQTLPILDLPLPEPHPKGWQWIEAYRYWSRMN